VPREWDTTGAAHLCRQAGRGERPGYVARLGPCRGRAPVKRVWTKGDRRRLTNAGPPSDSAVISQEEVDAYLEALDEPKPSTLRELRQTILEFVPGAEQCISYGVPAFRLQGKVIAGFAAFKRHLSYLPHSGSVFPELRDEVAPYVTSTGALQVPVDVCLSKPLVQKLLAVRIKQALPDCPSRSQCEAHGNLRGWTGESEGRGGLRRKASMGTGEGSLGRSGWSLDCSGLTA
jgi:uncharacterized protein YdhG (YjbR/CyaY superfamily)